MGVLSNTQVEKARHMLLVREKVQESVTPSSSLDAAKGAASETSSVSSSDTLEKQRGGGNSKPTLTPTNSIVNEADRQLASKVIVMP